MANESLVMTAEVRDNFSSTLRKLQTELKALSGTGAASTKTLRQDWKGVGSEIQTAAGSITRDMLPAMRQGNLAGLALGGTIGLAANALKNFAQNTSTVADFSKEIGLASREVAKLQAMGEHFGIDPSATRTNLRNFQDLIQAMEKGSGEAISNLRNTFGRAGDQLASELLKPSTFEKKVQIAFQAIRNVDSEPTARKMAQELFGNEAWASAIRNMTDAQAAAFAKAGAKIDENKEAAKRFNQAILDLNTAVRTLAEEGLTPALRGATELIDKLKEPVGQGLKDLFENLKTTVPAVTQAFKDFMEGNTALFDLLGKIDEFTSSSTIGGLATSALKRLGIVPGDKPLSPAEALAKSSGGGAAPGSPDKDIPKTNEDLRQTNEKLKTATEKQTSAFEKFLAIIGQGGDTAGLGPGMGGVSGGGGGLGGAGALAQFRSAVAAGGGGPSIRRGAATGGRVANAAKFGQVAPRLMNRLVTEHGLTRAQAAGVVGNLGHESAGFTAYEEGAPNKHGTRGAGWAQWTDTPGSPRRTMFENWAKQHGLDPRSDEASERYLFEGDPQFKQALEAVKGQSTTQGSMQAFEGSFERAGVKAYGSRLAYANRALAGSGAPPAALGDLRLKPGATGGGEAAAGAVDLARYAQSNVEGFNRVTALNDRMHQRFRSRHNQGLAMDFTIGGGAKDSEAALAKIRGELEAKGLEHGKDFSFLNEYTRASANKTGPHLHVQFQSQEAADRYRKGSLLDQQSRAEKAQQSKLEANGTVNVHLHDSLREKSAKVDTEGMFRDVTVNRGRAMGTAEDYTPLNRAAAGF